MMSKSQNAVLLLIGVGLVFTITMSSIEESGQRTTFERRQAFVDHRVVTPSVVEKLVCVDTTVCGPGFDTCYEPNPPTFCCEGEQICRWSRDNVTVVTTSFFTFPHIEVLFETNETVASEFFVWFRHNEFRLSDPDRKREQWGVVTLVLSFVMALFLFLWVALSKSPTAV